MTEKQTLVVIAVVCFFFGAGLMHLLLELSGR